MTGKTLPPIEPCQKSSCECASRTANSAPVEEPGSRRGFLKGAGALSINSLLGTAALMTNSDDARANTEWAEWFQGNYRLMTDAEKAQARARLERRYSREYGKAVTVDGTPAQEGVLFGYALDVKKCIGCRRCAKACVEENNQSRRKERKWVDQRPQDGEGRVQQGKDEPGLSRGPRDPGRRQRLQPGGCDDGGGALLPARGGPRKGCLLHAHRLHAVRKAAP